MTPADGFFNALYGRPRLFGIFVSNICSTKQSPTDRRFKKNSQGILLRPSSPARTYPSTYTAIADNSVVGVRSETRKSKTTMFPNETFCGGGRDDEEVQVSSPQLMQHHLSDTLHGRQNSDPLTFCQNTELGERCVRDEIFADDVSVHDREDRTSHDQTGKKTDDESLKEKFYKKQARNKKLRKKQV